MHEDVPQMARPTTPGVELLTSEAHVSLVVVQRLARCTTSRLRKSADGSA